MNIFNNPIYLFTFVGGHNPGAATAGADGSLTAAHLFPDERIAGVTVAANECTAGADQGTSC